MFRRLSSRQTARVGLALLLLASASCSRPPPTPEPHTGPIVLITIDALRADVVGALGGDPRLTPNLDRLAAESAWAEPAIAASSWTVPSMASILTGLQPWRHGNWHSGRPALSESVTTLAEALQSAGMTTVAFRSNTWLRIRFGYGQGFDEFYSLGYGKRAEARLASLDGSPELVWIHVLPPHSPYLFREELRDQVGDVPSPLPTRARALDLEPYFDPEVELPEKERAEFWALYRFNVAWADRVVGKLLDSLRSSGQWDSSMVVLTSDHGEEFGENGQMTHGGNLGRVLLEVPLFIKLPKSSEWRLEPTPWVANHRLYSTLVEMVGEKPPEAALPSLWNKGSDSPSYALSELYQGNGVNTFSMVADGEQLLWQSRFGPEEPDYFAARLATMGGEPSSPLDEAPEVVFARLATSFLDARPLFGRGEAPPALEL